MKNGNVFLFHVMYALQEANAASFPTGRHTLATNLMSTPKPVMELGNSSVSTRW